MSTKSALQIVAFLGLIAVAQSATSALDKSYVDALKADVDEFHSGRFNPPPDSAWVPARSREGVAVAERMANFDKLLRSKMRGSYIRYRQLSKWHREQIFHTYEKTGDLDRVKREILDTFQ